MNQLASCLFPDKTQFPDSVVVGSVEWMNGDRFTHRRYRRGSHLFESGRTHGSPLRTTGFPTPFIPPSFAVNCLSGTPRGGAAAQRRNPDDRNDNLDRRPVTARVFTECCLAIRNPVRSRPGGVSLFRIGAGALVNVLHPSCHRPLSSAHRIGLVAKPSRQRRRCHATRRRLRHFGRPTPDVYLPKPRSGRPAEY